jgi:hypothetical protein
LINLFFYRQIKEHFQEQEDNITKDKSCWQHLVDYKKWDLSKFDKNEKKTLMIMRKLQAKSFHDDNLNYPSWDKCVIPKDHLGVFNKDKMSKEPWDLYNETPDTNSRGYMRYSQVNETPDGYVIDLEKHDENSFKDFLGTAYRLYDKEFFDEKMFLEQEIIKWTDLFNQKTEELRLLTLKNNSILKQISDLNDPNSLCQRNLREYEELNNKYNKLMASPELMTI